MQHIQTHRERQSLPPEELTVYVEKTSTEMGIIILGPMGTEAQREDAFPTHTQGSRTQVSCGPVQLTNNMATLLVT